MTLHISLHFREFMKIADRCADREALRDLAGGDDRKPEKTRKIGQSSFGSVFFFRPQQRPSGIFHFECSFLAISMLKDRFRFDNSQACDWRLIGWRLIGLADYICSGIMRHGRH